ncbi:MAG TPA: hypothetical protein IAC38_02050 [Candidatus Caccovivens faecavium]|nr:hypothetical protein [Candidatus Caccovivens faecavium]
MRVGENCALVFAVVGIPESACHFWGELSDQMKPHSLCSLAILSRLKEI